MTLEMDAAQSDSGARPLSRALQNKCVFSLFDPGQGEVRGGPGGPPELSVGLPGPKPPGGPRGLRQTKATKTIQLKILTERWRAGRLKVQL